MLKYKQGDLLHAALSGEVDIIAHQANCKCTMGSGIARSIRETFPRTKIADDTTFEPRDPDGLKKMGTFSRVIDRGVLIYNLYGQQFYGKDKRHTHYGYLAKALFNMRNNILANNDEQQAIGLPLLGSVQAGGDWEVVSELIEAILEGLNVTIYVMDITHLPQKYWDKFPKQSEPVIDISGGMSAEEAGSDNGIIPAQTSTLSLPRRGRPPNPNKAG